MRKAGLIPLIFAAVVAWADAPRPSSENLYERLGISRRATYRQIVGAYRAFLDRGRNAPEEVRRVTEAHDMLIDSERRDAYDLQFEYEVPVPVLRTAAATKETLQRYELSIAGLRSIEVIRYVYRDALDYPAPGIDRPKYLWPEKLRKVLDLSFRDRALVIYRTDLDPVVRGEALCFVAEINKEPVEALLTSMLMEDAPVDPVFIARLRVLAPALRGFPQVDWARAIVWHQTEREARRAKNTDAASYIALTKILGGATNPVHRWPGPDDNVRVFLTALARDEFRTPKEVYEFVKHSSEKGSLFRRVVAGIHEEVPQTAPSGVLGWCGAKLSAVWNKIRHPLR